MHFARVLQRLQASANGNLPQECVRLSAATITLLQDLLYTLQTECQDCSAKADKMKRRSKSFFFIFNTLSGGCWELERLLLHVED